MGQQKLFPPSFSKKCIISMTSMPIVKAMMRSNWVGTRMISV